MADMSTLEPAGRAIYLAGVASAASSQLTTPLAPPLATATESAAAGADFRQPHMAPLSGYTLNYWVPDDASALVHALVASFSVILVSELGDKTFIITAIMAMKNLRSLVFLGSASALLLMTVMSVGMGVAATVIPEVYTHYASIVLFVCFGLRMLKEARDMQADQATGDEFEQVERSLGSSPKGGPELQEAAPKEAGEQPQKQQQQQQQQHQQQEAGSWLLGRLSSSLQVAPVFIKVFTMILVAEWGDRSQISTVILSAREDALGVFVGSLVGHIACSGLAVLGGRFVAEMISVRTMTFLGSLIFLAFALVEIVSGP